MGSQTFLHQLVCQSGHSANTQARLPRQISPRISRLLANGIQYCCAIMTLQNLLLTHFNNFIHWMNKLP